MTNINIDFVIILLYLALTLTVGIVYGRGTKSMASFALGGRNFSTGALAATITATYVSGSSFVMGITYGYHDGLLDFLATSGQIFVILLLSYVFIPRMGEFLGDFSIAESMRKMFGRYVGIITACSGIIISVGFVAMQLRILGDMFSYFSEIPVNIAIFMCAIVMIVYCVHSGIRGVIFTDILQFITFMVVVPGIAIGIWYKVTSIPDSHAYSQFISKAFSFESSSGTDYFTLFFYFLIPGFSPTFFQRVTASKTTRQAQEAFLHSSYLYFFYILVSSITGILLFVYNDSLKTDEIFPFMLEQFTTTGVLGLAFIAVISMSLSTADSHLNTFAVMFTHDICKQLGLVKSENAELKLTQISTILIGLLAAILAIYFKSLISLLLFSRNFYEPLIAPSIILAILGFRSSPRSVLTGMAFGFGTVVTWKVYQYFIPGILTIDSLIPGTLMNLVTYVGSHYLFNQPGGWVGPKDIDSLELANIKSKKFRQEHLDTIKTFISKIFFIPTANSHLLNAPAMNSLLGILIIASYFTVTISNPELSMLYPKLYHLQFCTCIVGALMITYPLWFSYFSDTIKNSISLYSLLYLVYTSTTLMFVHGFSSISIVSYIISILAIGFFGKPLATFLITLLSSLTSSFQYISSGYPVEFVGSDIAFVVAYGSFALAIILMSFVRRYQTEISDLTLSLSELAHMNNVLQSRIAMKDEKIATALDIRPDLLRNINHEVRTPINTLDIQTEFMIQRANEQKGTIPADLMRIMTSVRDASVRAYKYISNMLDLSLYQKSNMLFDIKPHNFKEFLEKLFTHKENILLKYDPNTPEIIEFDEVKMKELFEHIISNSEEVMKQRAKVDSDYSANDIITVSVTKTDKIHLNNQDWDRIEITVKDSGIGVPDAELKTIFEPFYISSRTKSPSGGRGIGLSLALEIVRMHNGDITAANNADMGVTMSVVLPVLHPRGDFLITETEQEEENVATDLIQIVSDVDRVKGKFFGRVPKVLMIDDERSIRDSADLMITSMCYEFMAIATGEEAVEYIMSKEFNADIVLLDMMLGDTTGLEVMKKVGAKLASLGVPVIIQSGLLAGDPNIQETLALGAKTSISKPYKRKDFQEKVKEYLGLAD